jgi:transposase
MATKRKAKPKPKPKPKPDPFAPTKCRIKALQKRLKGAADRFIFVRIQCVLFRVKENKSTREIAELTGISQSSVKSIHVRFRNEGFSIFRKQQRGGRVRQFLTIEQEREFLALFTQEAQAGHTLTIKNIHNALEEKLNHKVALSTVYRMLKRNKWRKLKPRPRHPKANLEDQKKFKRRLPHEVPKTVVEKEKLGIKVRLLAEDEGRFGLLGKPYRCWAPNKCRPTVGARLQRKYVYAYTVVSPHDGEMFSLILPYSNLSHK